MKTKLLNQQEPPVKSKILAIFVLVLSATLLLITWALFLVLSFVKILAKISPFKRKIRKGKNKPNKNEY